MKLEERSGKDYGDNVIIIGNGFDLNLGLKSSYGHFIDWMEQQYCLSVDKLNVAEELYKINKLFVRQHEDFVLNWWDFETIFQKEIQDINNGSQGNDLHSTKIAQIRELNLHLQELEELFLQYIKEEQENWNLKLKQTKNKKINNIWNYIFDGNPLILQYNYTDLLDKVVEQTTNGTRNNILYMHGRVQDNNIIMGSGFSGDGHELELAINESLMNDKLLRVISDEKLSRNRKIIRDRIKSKEEIKNLYIIGHSIRGTDYPIIFDLMNKAQNIHLFYYENDYLLKLEHILKYQFKDKRQENDKLIEKIKLIPIPEYLIKQDDMIIRYINENNIGMNIPEAKFLEKDDKKDLVKNIAEFNHALWREFGFSFEDWGTGGFFENYELSKNHFLFKYIERYTLRHMDIKKITFSNGSEEAEKIEIILKNYIENQEQILVKSLSGIKHLAVEEYNFVNGNYPTKLEKLESLTIINSKISIADEFFENLYDAHSLKRLHIEESDLNSYDDGIEKISMNIMLKLHNWSQLEWFKFIKNESRRQICLSGDKFLLNKLKRYEVIAIEEQNIILDNGLIEVLKKVPILKIDVRVHAGIAFDNGINVKLIYKYADATNENVKISTEKIRLLEVNGCELEELKLGLIFGNENGNRVLANVELIIFRNYNINCLDLSQVIIPSTGSRIFAEESEIKIVHLIHFLDESQLIGNWRKEEEVKDIVQSFGCDIQLSEDKIAPNIDRQNISMKVPKESTIVEKTNIDLTDSEERRLQSLYQEYQKHLKVEDNGLAIKDLYKDIIYSEDIHIDKIRNIFDGNLVSRRSQAKKMEVSFRDLLDERKLFSS